MLSEIGSDGKGKMPNYFTYMYIIKNKLTKNNPAKTEAIQIQKTE